VTRAELWQRRPRSTGVTMTPKAPDRSSPMDVTTMAFTLVTWLAASVVSVRTYRAGCCAPGWQLECRGRSPVAGMVGTRERVSRG
jgi:hypothetical protein